MNLEIMRFANAFAYQDQLKCDSDDVKSATIQINHSSVVCINTWLRVMLWAIYKFQFLLQIVDKHNWLDLVLSSSVQHSVIFLNTSNLTMPDSSSFYCNQLEVDVAAIIINAFKEVSVWNPKKKWNDICEWIKY